MGNNKVRVAGRPANDHEAKVIDAEIESLEREKEQLGRRRKEINVRLKGLARCRDVDVHPRIYSDGDYLRCATCFTDLDQEPHWVAEQKELERGN